MILIHSEHWQCNDSGDGGQFFDGFPKGQDRHRSALQIVKDVFVIDAKMSVDRSPEIVGGQESFDWMLAFSVRGADHLPGLHPATRHQH